MQRQRGCKRIRGNQQPKRIKLIHFKELTVRVEHSFPAPLRPGVNFTANLIDQLSKFSAVRDGWNFILDDFHPKQKQILFFRLTFTLSIRQSLVSFDLLLLLLLSSTENKHQPSPGEVTNPLQSINTREKENQKPFIYQTFEELRIKERELRNQSELRLLAFYC